MSPPDALVSYEYWGRLLAYVSGSKVIMVDYRLAPEFKYPVPLNDCYDAIHWIKGTQKNDRQQFNLTVVYRKQCQIELFCL
jgi:acetyl esterase/lipase